ncbi:hypothetical protein ABFV57_05060, partial [Pseudomonas neuropathica]|uniref:hypothetical protein n=1 Tax=Pseudomonas neuropathica TaxID=2730425 RepID=UPI0034D764A3
LNILFGFCWLFVLWFCYVIFCVGFFLFSPRAAHSYRGSCGVTHIAGTKKPDSMVGLFLSAKTAAYLARPL